MTEASSQARPASRWMAPARAVAVVAGYAPDVRERLYELCSGPAAINAAAAIRYYEQEVEPGTPVPTTRTVERWVVELGWRARLEADLARNHGALLYEMQLGDLLRYAHAGEKLSEILAGAYDDNPMAGALIIKTREVLGREIERRIKPVLPAVDKTGAERLCRVEPGRTGSGDAGRVAGAAAVVSQKPSRQIRN